MLKIKSLVLSFLLMSCAGHAAELVFTFANGSVSGSSPKIYEFDVMVSTDQAGTQLGDTQVYINYSTDGFGSDVVKNGKITATKGTLLTADYQIVNMLDNSASRFAVTVDYTDAGGTASAVTSSPTPLLHIAIEVADDSKSAGLIFDDALMTNQQYLFDDATKYAPITAGNSDDSKFTPISVDLVSFSAMANEQGVLLQWRTANEINLAGFNVFRSADDQANDIKINDRLIPASIDNQMNGAEYNFLDQPPEYATYYYTLQSVDLDGAVAFHQAYKVDFTTKVTTEPLPTEFRLEQNFPNPFNPETMIRYEIPASAFVEITIYNLHGRRVKKLVQMTQAVGDHSILWDGLDEDSRQVGSGTYILLMKAGDFRDVKRLTLLR